MLWWKQFRWAVVRWEGRWVDGAHSRERARAHWTIPETYPGPGIFSFSHYKFSLNLSNILNFYSFKYLIVFKTWKQIIKTLILQHLNCNLNICWILQWKNPGLKYQRRQTRENLMPQQRHNIIRIITGSFQWAVKIMYIKEYILHKIFVVLKQIFKNVFFFYDFTEIYNTAITLKFMVR